METSPLLWMNWIRDREHISKCLLLLVSHSRNFNTSGSANPHFIVDAFLHFSLQSFPQLEGGGPRNKMEGKEGGWCSVIFLLIVSFWTCPNCTELLGNLYMSAHAWGRILLLEASALKSFFMLHWHAYLLKSPLSSRHLAGLVSSRVSLKIGPRDPNPKDRQWTPVFLCYVDWEVDSILCNRYMLRPQFLKSHCFDFPIFTSKDAFSLCSQYSRRGYIACFCVCGKKTRSWARGHREDKHMVMWPQGKLRSHIVQQQKEVEFWRRFNFF